MHYFSIKGPRKGFIMGDQGISLLNLATQRLDWLTHSQRVVAENVANADTPGFAARRTAAFSEMLGGAAPTMVATTRAGHIAGLGGTSPVRVEADPNVWDRSLDGNTVVLEQQTIRSGQIDAEYRLAAGLYRKGHEFLRMTVSS